MSEEDEAETTVVIDWNGPPSMTILEMMEHAERRYDAVPAELLSPVRCF